MTAKSMLVRPGACALTYPSPLATPLLDSTVKLRGFYVEFGTNSQNRESPDQIEKLDSLFVLFLSLSLSYTPKLFAFAYCCLPGGQHPDPTEH